MRETQAPWVEDIAVLAAKNEYLDDALRKAAEIVFLLVQATGTDPHGALEMPEWWLGEEVPQLRAVLAFGGPRSDLRVEAWRWKALGIAELPRSVSSAIPSAGK